MMTNLSKNTFAIDKKTGRCYVLTTNTLQSRNRRQCQDMRIYKSVTKQIAESALVPVTDFEGELCFKAEKIQRGMMKHSDADKTILALHKDLLARVRG